MRRFLIAVALCTATVAALPTATATANSRGVTTATTATTNHVAQYSRDYRSVARKFGRKAPGRNIVKWGLVGGKTATDAQVVRSDGVLERMLQPSIARAPTTPAFTQGSSVQTGSAASYYSGGGYSIPGSIVQCESGGNYSAVNPSSGAGGAYQILPSTWQAYGGQGLPENAPKSEQDRIAGEIYAKQGPGAWVC